MRVAAPKPTDRCPKCGDERLTDTCVRLSCVMKPAPDSPADRVSKVIDDMLTDSPAHECPICADKDPDCPYEPQAPAQGPVADFQRAKETFDGAFEERGEVREYRPYWLPKHGHWAYANPTEPTKYPEAFFELVPKDAYDALKASRHELRLKFDDLALEKEKLRAENEKLQQIAHVTGEETYRAKAKTWQGEIEELRNENAAIKANEYAEYRDEKENKLRAELDMWVVKYHEACNERDAARERRDWLQNELNKFIDAQKSFGDDLCAEVERLTGQTELYLKNKSELNIENNRLRTALERIFKHINLKSPTDQNLQLAEVEDIAREALGEK